MGPEGRDTHLIDHKQFSGVACGDPMGERRPSTDDPARVTCFICRSVMRRKAEEHFANDGKESRVVGKHVIRVPKSEGNSKTTKAERDQVRETVRERLADLNPHLFISSFFACALLDDADRAEELEDKLKRPRRRVSTVRADQFVLRPNGAKATMKTPTEWADALSEHSDYSKRTPHEAALELFAACQREAICECIQAVDSEPTGDWNAIVRVLRALLPPVTK